MSRLYSAHGPAIYARCQRLLRDRALAEDATQEVFIRIYRHIEKAPGSDEVLAWVYRIATNYCLNEIRGRKRRREVDWPTAELQVSGNLESALLDRDLAARLVEAAPTRVRAVAWLHFVDGMDQTEVARVLGLSRRTVVHRMRAFIELARKLAAG
ncbi:MAG TPA: sigma-70 family RNA polymerase sigma factor [Polyangia bacterium]|nr:sigma-70 family RNA polymerase sigma factor [Polyangia bacterium]